MCRFGGTGGTRLTAVLGSTESAVAECDGSELVAEFTTEERKESRDDPDVRDMCSRADERSERGVSDRFPKTLGWEAFVHNATG